MTKRRWCIEMMLVALGVAIILIFHTARVAATEETGEIGDFGFGHHQYHRWYNTGENGGPLLRPSGPPGIKCCDDDCRPTKARLINGVWEAWIDRRWVVIPADKIKRNVSNPTTWAHVCASRTVGVVTPPTIYCFIEPELES